MCIRDSLHGVGHGDALPAGGQVDVVAHPGDPVSYTHLDVYKRQDLRRQQAGAPGVFTERPGDGAGAAAAVLTLSLIHI